jgi:phenylpropionate dioxygenase-like ring-hydroxylating dioxygenase large terminal subunit
MNSDYYQPVLSAKDLFINTPKRVVLNNTPIVLVKTTKGIVAYEDFCPHRGLALSEGFMFEEQLHCKYHGWSFDIRNGENTFVPVKNNKTTCKLKPIFVKECYEIVWLSYLKDAILPRLSESKPSMFLTGKIKAEITHVLENFLDGSHTHFVHDGIVRSKNKKRNAIAAELINTPEGFIVNYQSEPPKGLITQLLPHKYRSLTPNSTYLHPGIVKLKYINHEQIEIACFEAILITDGEETKYFARVFINIGWISRLIYPLARLAFKKVIQQDKKILELHQKNLSCFEEKKFFTDETDTVGKYIYAWQNSKNLDLPNQASFIVYW